MNARDVSDLIKRSTVAVIQRPANPTAQRPFKIIGSGFCVHSAGIVLTCNHVFESFLKDQHYKSVLERVSEGVHVPTPISVFSVLFNGGADGSKVFMHETVPAEVGIVNTFDIAAFKIRKHPQFPDGFPALPLAEYSDLHEMMDVATCG